MKCDWCGGLFVPEYENQTTHDDIYDCCDNLNPFWMVEWKERLQKEKEYQKNYVSNFVKWCRETNSIGGK